MSIAMPTDEIRRADCERSMGGRRPCDGDLDAIRLRLTAVGERISLTEQHVSRMADAQERMAALWAGRFEWVTSTLGKIPWWGWPIILSSPIIATVGLLLVVQGHGPEVLDAVRSVP